MLKPRSDHFPFHLRLLLSFLVLHRPSRLPLSFSSSPLSLLSRPSRYVPDIPKACCVVFGPPSGSRIKKKSSESLGRIGLPLSLSFRSLTLPFLHRPPSRLVSRPSFARPYRTHRPLISALPATWHPLRSTYPSSATSHTDPEPILVLGRAPDYVLESLGVPLA